MQNRCYAKKIAIVGLGNVGAAFAFALVLRRLATDIVLIDLDHRRAEGEVLDLRHGLPLVGPMNVFAGTYGDCADADIVVITAGAGQKPGQTRLELLQQNAGIAADIVRSVLAAGGSPVLLMTTNPVDVLTRVALNVAVPLGLPPGKVFGSGTVLDSSRFRHLLSETLSADPRGVHASVLGEHGDSEVCIWSRANVSSIPVGDVMRARGLTLDSAFKDQMALNVRRAAYEIINRKGHTATAIAVSLCRIVETIVNDQKSVLTVSTDAEGCYGLPRVCMSLPCVVGAGGVEAVIDTPLAPEEEAALRRSGEVLFESGKTLL
ncbi:MAG: L-lactate dehydrogenase [Humidesulfovibrio sp.]|nr:L-lactate dehydrogenase [Humidesulfovibrio sp.]